MHSVDHLRLLARYNQWMNAKLHRACGTLPEETLRRDRKAFFGSIRGTLNHLLVADILWLKRFGAHPRGFAALQGAAALADPVALNQIVAPSLAEWQALRAPLDEMFVAWADDLRESDLDATLTYRTMSGEERHDPFGAVVLHVFNHQTHHRGQISTLLSQEGVDVGVTDLLAFIRTEA